MIQWPFPYEFKDKYFAFMGGLHLEMATQNCIGQLLKGTGVDTVRSQAALDITGLTTAVCDANNIKKARYTLQVLAVCLTSLLLDACKLKLNEDEDVSFDDWIYSEINIMFRYWNFTLEKIIIYLMFVRSFREASFLLLISSLKKIVPLFCTGSCPLCKMDISFCSRSLCA